jgi:hypothetical protein
MRGSNNAAGVPLPLATRSSDERSAEEFKMPLIYAIGIAVAAQLLIYSGLTFMVGGEIIAHFIDSGVQSRPSWKLSLPGFQCHGHIGGKLLISALIFVATGIKCRNYFFRDGSMHSKYGRFDY